jgi:hypothetical protein
LFMARVRARQQAVVLMVVTLVVVTRDGPEVVWCLMVTS